MSGLKNAFWGGDPKLERRRMEEREDIADDDPEFPELKKLVEDMDRTGRRVNNLEGKIRDLISGMDKIAEENRRLQDKSDSMMTFLEKIDAKVEIPKGKDSKNSREEFDMKINLFKRLWDQFRRDYGLGSPESSKTFFSHQSSEKIRDLCERNSILAIAATGLDHGLESNYDASREVLVVLSKKVRDVVTILVDFEDLVKDLSDSLDSRWEGLDKKEENLEKQKKILDERFEILEGVKKKFPEELKDLEMRVLKKLRKEFDGKFKEIQETRDIKDEEESRLGEPERDLNVDEDLEGEEEVVEDDLPPL